MSVNEQSLIEANQKFMLDFYEQYISYMYYAARKYTTDQRECEDIVSDALVRLLKRVCVLRGLDKNKTIKYITLTIRSVFLDRLRSGIDKEYPTSDELLEFLQSEQEANHDTELEYSALWDAEILRRAMSEKDWDLLEAKYILGYTDEEIAREKKYAPDSVRTLLRRARQRAKSILSTEPQGKE